MTDETLDANWNMRTPLYPFFKNLIFLQASQSF